MCLPVTLSQYCVSRTDMRCQLMPGSQNYIYLGYIESCYLSVYIQCEFCGIIQQNRNVLFSSIYMSRRLSCSFAQLTHWVVFSLLISVTDIITRFGVIVEDLSSDVSF